MRLFALIGYPLSHSFSEKYFTEKFIREQITDATFKLFPIETIELLPQMIQSNGNLNGFAITIPHKKTIIPYLYSKTDAVKKMGACNCVRIIDGKLYGHNTDVIGFEQSFIQYLQPNHTKALVLGTGGASAAVEFVLQKLAIDYVLVSRTKNIAQNILSYADINDAIMKEYSVIINTTPLGTFPNVDEAPAIPYELISSQHYLFDLVYNPAETKFLQLGKLAGATTKNGYDMLVLQADENWKIWNT